MTAYVEVPYLHWEGVAGRPPSPTAIVSTAQRQNSRSEQPPSLGSLSIKDTPTIKPGEKSWQSYRACPDYVKQKYGKLLQDFCRYIDMCDNSGFQAEGIAVGSPCKKYNGTRGMDPRLKNDWGKRKVSGPLLNRWHPKRRTAWIAKMHTVAQWYEANRINGCTLITLTGYQENSGLSFYDTWDAISESRVKLLKILRKYIGKISYFWVVEPHTKNETGYPHFHLAVFADVDNEIRDSFGEGMQDKLKRLYSEEWGTGSHTYGLDFQQMKGQNDIKDLKNYLMKYISKGYIGDEIWSPGELIFNAHLYGATHGNRPPKPGDQLNIKGEFAKRYRCIGMSRDLSAIIRPFDEDKEDIVWLHVDETEPTERKDEEGNFVTSERVKTLFDRQLIPDWLNTWRELAKIQSWQTRVYDEKAARRARKIQQDGYL
jgi:hypothetical protein